MPTAFVSHPVSSTRCQSPAVADQPSLCAVRMNTGPPAALQPELLTLAIMHLASLQPSSTLPAFTFRSLFTTPAFMDSQVHHSGYFMYPTTTTHAPTLHAPLPPIPIPSSMFRLLSNYSWYLAWVTVFNNVFKNKKGIIKRVKGREAAKRPVCRAARWGSMSAWWAVIGGFIWVILAAS